MPTTNQFFSYLKVKTPSHPVSFYWVRHGLSSQSIFKSIGHCFQNYLFPELNETLRYPLKNSCRQYSTRHYFSFHLVLIVKIASAVSTIHLYTRIKKWFFTALHFYWTKWDGICNDKLFLKNVQLRKYFYGTLSIKLKFRFIFYQIFFIHFSCK